MGNDEKEASETAAEAVRIQEEDTDRIQESEISDIETTILAIMHLLSRELPVHLLPQLSCRRLQFIVKSLSRLRVKFSHLFNGKGEVKVRSFFGLRLNPYSPPVVFYYFFADGKPDPCS